MDIETITKLLDAGYTKAEIEALGANAGTGESEENLAGNEDAGKVESETSAQNAGEVVQDDAIKALTDTVNTLTATVKAMQENNIKSVATESPKTSDKIKAAMDSFIESL